MFADNYHFDYDYYVHDIDHEQRNQLGPGKTHNDCFFGIFKITFWVSFAFRMYAYLVYPDILVFQLFVTLEYLTRNMISCNSKKSTT